MSASRCIRTVDVPSQPWRNGGGVTRELLAWPNAADWRVRISVADVARDGPFSAFPNVRRWFGVLAGKGVELDFGGRVHRLRCGDAPLEFAGDAAVECRLIDGVTRDLNLMLRGVAGTMSIAVDGVEWVAPVGLACGFYSLVEGRCESRARPAPTTRAPTTSGDSTVGVPADTLTWFEQAPGALRFHAAQADVKTPVGFWLAAEMNP